MFAPTSHSGEKRAAAPLVKPLRRSSPSSSRHLPLKGEVTNKVKMPRSKRTALNFQNKYTLRKQGSQAM